MITERQRLYLDGLFNTKNKPKVSLNVTDAQLIGETKIQNLKREYILAFQRLDIFIDSDKLVQLFSRALINDELIHTIEYKRFKKRKKPSCAASK